MFRKLAALTVLALATASPALADRRAAFNQVDRGSAVCIEQNYQAQFNGISMKSRIFVGADQNVYLIRMVDEKCHTFHQGFVGDGSHFIEDGSLVIYAETDKRDDSDYGIRNGLWRREFFSVQEQVSRFRYFPGVGDSAHTPYTDGNDAPSTYAPKFYSVD